MPRLDFVDGDWHVREFQMNLKKITKNLTTVAARQILMPAINQATDSGNKKRFIWLHGFSVVLTLGHIITAGVVLSRAVV